MLNNKVKFKLMFNFYTIRIILSNYFFKKIQSRKDKGGLPWMQNEIGEFPVSQPLHYTKKIIPGGKRACEAPVSTICLR